MSDYKDNPEELEISVQKALAVSFQHLQSISEYFIKSSPVSWYALEETICTVALSHDNSMNANEDYDLQIRIVALPVPEKSSLRSTYIYSKSLYLTPIENIILQWSIRQYTRSEVLKHLLVIIFLVSSFQFSYFCDTYGRFMF